MKTGLLITFLILLSATLFSQSTWNVEAKNINSNEYYGVTLANGVIGLVSSKEPLKVSDVVLNGTYDYYQRGRVSNILKVFNHMNMNLDINGARINSNNISDYSQKLKMDQATLETNFKVPNQVIVKTEMMALRHLPYSSLILVEITALDDINITPMSVIEAPNHLRNVKNYYAEIDRPHVRIPLLTSTALSPTGKVKLAASNAFIFKESHENQPILIHEDWDYNMHLLKFHKELKKGETYKFAIIGSTCSSEQYEDPHNEAERLTIYAMLEGTDRLIKRHYEEWNELWESNITIQNDPLLTRDIRFALYHLYSFARKNTSYSLSPMGLSGLGYNGHVFWDTELWMFPPLLLLQPEIAESLLNYRFERLEAAKQNAFAHGYDGAMFPWESAADGSEDTPVWALTGPFEHHISGCIAWAFWKYFEVTKDKKWLLVKGYPVLSEIADFWASRVERNGPGQYDINNVVAADEWAENVNNNAFTNAVAILSLQYATLAAQELNIEANPDWNHVAENIPILSFDNGVTKEHQTYNGEPIKQADVNLLAYPLGIISDKSQIKKDLEYYEPLMSPTGPAMGSAILSILYNRLGNTDKASQVFTYSYKRNEVPPFGVISEAAGGKNPYFATGAGGMLQAVLSGFGGLVISSDGIKQTKSTIPDSWGELKITGIGIENQTITIK